MEKRKFLFDSIEQFLKTPVWEGERFYDAKHYRPWFGWIYIALFEKVSIENYKSNTPDVRFKIGRSSNIDRRNKELFRDTDEQDKSSIVFVWSVPLCIRFESDLKTLLSAFIMPDRAEKKSGSSEIVWGIPIIPLISIIQLSILKTCLTMRYIRSDVEFTLRPPDTIKDKGAVYPGRRKYMLPHELVLDKLFAQLNIKHDNPVPVEDYIFLQDKRIPLETINTYTTQEFEGDFLNYSDDPVYAIGKYVYAKYTRNGKSTFWLAKIIGYGTTKSQKYAVRWVVQSPDNMPNIEGDGLELSNYKWEFTDEVKSIYLTNPVVYNKIKDIEGVKIGNKAKVPKLRV